MHMNDLMMSCPVESKEQSATPTVLVVEDELLVRLTIAEFLRDCGYNVLEAGNASEAIETMEAHGAINLVFTDVRMPGRMDGVDLARWCDAHHPEIPVLLTSGYNAGRIPRDEAGLRAKIIQKPYSQAQVARQIAAAIAKSH